MSLSVRPGILAAMRDHLVQQEHVEHERQIQNTMSNANWCCNPIPPPHAAAGPVSSNMRIEEEEESLHDIIISELVKDL
jgi:hypothetical protein